MKKLSILFVLASLLALSTACSNKKEESAPVQDAGRDTRAITTNLNIPRGQCTSQLQQAFVVANGSSSTFDLAVQVFISPTMDPAGFGEVSMSQGIKISGYVDRDANNNLLMASSLLRLEVWDSWAIQSANGDIQDQIDPLVVELKGISASGVGTSVTMVFGDELGTVTLVGTVNGNQFNAAVEFQNKVTQTWTPKKSDGTAYSAGNLGNVSLPTNGFFRCQ